MFSVNGGVGRTSGIPLFFLFLMRKLVSIYAIYSIMLSFPGTHFLRNSFKGLMYAMFTLLDTRAFVGKSF